MLLVLSLCEAVSLLVFSAHWVLMMWVFLQVSLAGCTSVYSLYVCQHTGDHNVPRLQGLLLGSLAFQLLTLCFIMCLATHKILGSAEIVCVTMAETQECSEQEPWWQLSVAALCLEGTLSLLSSATILLLLRHISKAALELRYRSLAFYLEL